MYLYSARITREAVMQFNQERLNKHPKLAKFGANCQLYARDLVQHFFCHTAGKAHVRVWKRTAVCLCYGVDNWCAKYSDPGVVAA
jgi:hypothetical protein